MVDNAQGWQGFEGLPCPLLAQRTSYGGEMTS